MSDERLERIEHRLDRLEVGQAELKAELKSEVGGLRRHMGVLHGEVLDSIRSIPDPTHRLERMIKAEVGELREQLRGFRVLGAGQRLE